jgi:hypothetical protein
VAYNNDISRSNKDSSRTVNLRAGSRYYVGVTNYTGTRGGQYVWSVNGPSVPDDRYEQNDTQAQAANLGAVNPSLTVSNLALVDDQDWFRFDMANRGELSDRVTISFVAAQGDLDLRLYDTQGNIQRVGSLAGDTEQLLLTSLPAGTYFIQVHGKWGARNPNYSLEIRVGRPANGDDQYEDNDSRAQAYNLGVVSRTTALNNLALADSQDWYRFGLDRQQYGGANVRITFDAAAGNLHLRLVDAQGRVLREGERDTNGVKVSLSGLSAGTYFVQVVGVDGALNPRYHLVLTPFMVRA